MKKKVLVTGASGLVGRALVKALIGSGYAVNTLSRRSRFLQADSADVHCYHWDVTAGEIDTSCVDGVEGIIHLAGENIGALPWSNSRKQAIVESRKHSISLLYDLLKKKDINSTKTVVSASASGYYSDRGDEWMSEDKPPATDFLGQTCVAWEHAVAQGRDLGLRTVSLRSGIVLSSQGGIYPQFADVMKWHIGIIPGSGNQWVPWIHIEDAVAMYLFALEHRGLQGVYNMAAPEIVSFATLVRTIAQQTGRKAWLPRIPGFLLRAILGQMSETLLSSTRMSVEKISSTGFQFIYPKLADAIDAIVNRQSHR